MKSCHRMTMNLVAMATSSALLVACAAPMTKATGTEQVRSKLTLLQADPQLANRAPVSLNEAELAVQAAEAPQSDVAHGKHLLVVADHKVDIARAQSQTLLAEAQRTQLQEERAQAILAARTLEADRAHNVADVARHDARHAQSRVSDMQKQIEALNARSTERGLVVMLGDVLFDSGKAKVKTNGVGNLDKLAAFLNQYHERQVSIEGHTDNVGSDAANIALSQRRAEAVKQYLVGHGVSAERITVSGHGESMPVSDNDSDYGRQQNRRVEVVIANTMTSSIE